MTATFKSIEQHLDAVDFDQLESEYHARGAEKALGALPKQLCQVFQAVKPILEVIKNLPLIPEQWRKGIALLITILGGICAI